MYPKCFPYWIIEDEKIQNIKVKEITYSSRGFLLPCCWCDKTYETDDLTKFNLFDESLRLANNQSVDEILSSSIWQDFFNNLYKNDTEKLPNICKKKCATLPTWGSDELQRLSSQS